MDHVLEVAGYGGVIILPLDPRRSEYIQQRGHVVSNWHQNVFGGSGGQHRSAGLTMPTLEERNRLSGLRVCVSCGGWFAHCYALLRGNKNFMARLGSLNDLREVKGTNFSRDRRPCAPIPH